MITTKRCVPLIIVGFLLLGQSRVLAEEQELSVVVRQIESYFHVKRTHIPLWGLLKPFIHVSAHGKGIGLDVAIFEDHNFVASNPMEFENKLQKALGEQWQPIIRVISRHDHEQTLIYAKPVGKQFKMLIVALESSEASVVKLQVNWHELANWVDDAKHKSKDEG
jgi:hypothetical protein